MFSLILSFVTSLSGAHAEAVSIRVILGTPAGNAEIIEVRTPNGREYLSCPLSTVKGQTPPGLTTAVALSACSAIGPVIPGSDEVISALQTVHAGLLRSFAADLDALAHPKFFATHNLVIGSIPAIPMAAFVTMGSKRILRTSTLAFSSLTLLGATGVYYQDRQVAKNVRRFLPAFRSVIQTNYLASDNNVNRSIDEFIKAPEGASLVYINYVRAFAEALKIVAR